MEPKLDRSVPKDQIFFLALAIMVGVAIGLMANFAVFGSNGVGPFPIAIAYGLMGAFLGCLGVGFYRMKRIRSGMPLFQGFQVVSAAVSLLWALNHRSVAGPTITFFLAAWLGAFAVISCYHSIKVRLN
jgi:hypothetical protein